MECSRGAKQLDHRERSYAARIFLIRQCQSRSYAARIFLIRQGQSRSYAARPPGEELKVLFFSYNVRLPRKFEKESKVDRGWKIHAELDFKDRGIEKSNENT